MAHEMTQSLVDMIMDQDEHHHAPLLALMILSLGDEYLQRNRMENGATTRWIVGVRICGASTARRQTRMMRR